MRSSDLVLEHVVVLERIVCVNVGEEFGVGAAQNSFTVLTLYFLQICVADFISSVNNTSS